MALNSRLILTFAAAVFSGAVILTPLMAAEPSRPPATETSDTNSTAHKAGETAGSAWQSGKDAVRKAWDVTKETARNAWHSGKETAKDAWGATKEKTGEVTRDVKEGWKDGQK